MKRTRWQRVRHPITYAHVWKTPLSEVRIREVERRLGFSIGRGGLLATAITEAHRTR